MKLKYKMWNVKKTDSNNNQTEYIYNQQNKIKEVKTATGDTVKLNYDANGNTTKVEARDKVITLKYDKMNRPVEVLVPEGLTFWVCLCGIYKSCKGLHTPCIHPNVF